MKIVILSKFQNSISRGAETFVLELALRLSRNNVVDILAGKEADSLKKILAGKFDVVISMNGGLQGLKASLGRNLGKYKLIIIGQSGIGRGAIWNILVVKPDVFVALTDHMASWARHWAWGTKVVKIPNGVDLEKFSSVGEKINIGLPEPIILSVGALAWYKHHEKLISAMSKVNRGSLLIVGSGEGKDKLKEMGQRLLRDRFKIMDLGYEDMPKVYRSCNLFSLPSWDREAFGIAYIEAMASGLGVVAPDDEPRREIIGNGGLFTDVSSPEIYAKTISNALDIDWSTTARDQAKKFSWEKIADEYEKLMFDMIKV